MVRSVLLALVLTATLLGGHPWTAPAQAAGGPTSTATPQVLGSASLGNVLSTDRGAWDPEPESYSFRWLRDGQPIGSADRRRYRPRVRDVGHQLSVRVTATDSGGSTSATSDPVRVTQGTIRNLRRPGIDGARRYAHTLKARAGAWSVRPKRTRYQWLRNGKAIKGATGPRRRLGLSDFGARMSVRVTVSKPGYRTARATSPQTVRIMHRVPTRRTVTYHVRTRGRIVSSMKIFRRQAQQTFDDPRGWANSGTRFKRVRRGGDFTLVLSEARAVPSFSSGCSSQWSCRVGRYVIINQMRWRGATPMWKSRNRSLRSYRHMVLNHETGHWLGWGHRGCPGRGALAPVMMQQSINLDGCRPNPWPRPGEYRVPRFS